MLKKEGTILMKQNEKQMLSNRKFGAGMVIGMGLGALCGLLADNVPLGVAIGVPIGIGLGTALQNSVDTKEFSHDE